MSCPRVSRVRVLARVRPVFEEGETVLATSLIDSTVTINVAQRKTPLKARLPKAAKHVPEKQTYKFDHVLGQHATQEDMCSLIDVPDKVAASVNGNLCLCFAFGQTGSGKTHTILGSHDMGRPSSGPRAETRRASQEDGILYSVLQKGFLAASKPSRRSCEISVSVLEVYKERVMDLLHKKQEVQVKHTVQQGFYAHGAKKVVCKDFPQAASILQKALLHRLTSSHGLNDTSSRSHAIVIVHFDTWATEGTSEAGEAAEADKLFSVVMKATEARKAAASTRVVGQDDESSLLTQSGEQPGAAHDVHVPEAGSEEAMPGQVLDDDLAGSERLKATGTQDDVGVSESCAINRSLFALGRVMNAVSETSQGRQQKVPYRDSVLTKLLSNSLQHAAQITMIACLHPLSTHIGQSTSTLQFAKVALSIKTKPVEHIDPHDKMVMDLKEIVSRLRKENQSLADAFLWLCSGKADWHSLIKTLPPSLCKRLPSTAGLLLVSPQSAPDTSSYVGPDSRKTLDAELATPQTPSLPVTPQPICSRPKQECSARLMQESVPDYSIISSTEEHRTASKQLINPASKCIHKPENPAPSCVEQFPELAALECEFQDLVCRPSTMEESAEQHTVQKSAAQPAARQIEPSSQSQSVAMYDTPKPRTPPPAGIDFSPNVLRDVLKASEDVQRPNLGTLTPHNGMVNRNRFRGDWPSVHQPFSPQVESDAMLWAMHNLWFGVEDDMTSTAYKMADKLEAQGIVVSAEYYNLISSHVKACFPEKWAQYSDMGSTLNTMSRQQGIMNSSVTLEAGLSNRASWADMRRRRRSTARLSDRPRGNGGTQQCITCITPRHGSAADPAIHCKLGTYPGCDESSPWDARRRNSSRAGRSLKPATPSACKPRGFSQERCKTPGERMRDRLAAKLGITFTPPDAADSDKILASWNSMGTSTQSSRVSHNPSQAWSSDYSMHEGVTTKAAPRKGSRLRRPWSSSLETSQRPVGEVDASTLGRSEIGDVDDLASQYLKQSSGRQRSLKQMVARHAAVMESL